MAGTIGTQTPLAIVFQQGAAGAADNDYTMTRAALLVDVTVYAQASQTGGTLLVGKGATAITNAIIAATDTNVTRAGTIDDAQNSLAVGNTLRFTTAGAATKVTAVAWLIPSLASITTI